MSTLFSCFLRQAVFSILQVLSCSPLYVQDGQTALYIAAKEGHTQVAEVLLSREADVNHLTKVRLILLVTQISRKSYTEF